MIFRHEASALGTHWRKATVADAVVHLMRNPRDGQWTAKVCPFNPLSDDVWMHMHRQTEAEGRAECGVTNDPDDPAYNDPFVRADETYVSLDGEVWKRVPQRVAGMDRFLTMPMIEEGLWKKLAEMGLVALSLYPEFITQDETFARTDPTWTRTTPAVDPFA